MSNTEFAGYAMVGLSGAVAGFLVAALIAAVDPEYLARYADASPTLNGAFLMMGIAIAIATAGWVASMEVTAHV